MQRHVHLAARSGRGAVPGHVQEGCFGHTGVGGRERALVEADDLPARGRGARAQRAIQVIQNRAGLVVAGAADAAMADVRRGVGRAVVAEARRDDGMPRRHLVDVLQVAGLDADLAEERHRGIHRRLAHDGVVGAAEDVNLAPTQIGKGVDRAIAGKVAGEIGHQRRVGRKGRHLAHADAGKVDVVRRAVIGAARDHAGADDRVRIRHLQLHGHEGTRRETGNRGLLRVRAVGRKRWRGGQRASGGAGQEGAGERPKQSHGDLIRCPKTELGVDAADAGPEKSPARGTPDSFIVGASFV